MNPALVIVGLLLVLANGVFVAMEFALVASRRTKLQTLAGDGDARARFAVDASSDLSLQLAGTQLGVTMASLLLGAVAEPTISDGIEKLFGLVGSIPDGVVSAFGVLFGLGIVVCLHLIFGEMVPKYVALADPERTLLRLAILNRVYFALFRPVIRVLSAIARFCLRLLRVEPRDELVTAHTAEEISMMVSASREGGLIEQSAHDLLSGALDFGDRRLVEVMVPLDQVVWVDRQSTVAEAESKVVESGHSRLLVMGRDQDDVVGFVHAKDLLTVAPEARARPLPLSRIRRVLTLDAGRSLDEVLVAMRQTRTHVAAVVDAERHVVGFATLEDVLEDLVGDIVDESDADNRPRLRPRRRAT